MPKANILATSASLSVQSFTSSEAGAWSNSYFISGESEGILFDVFMLRKDAAQIVEAIAKSGKNLTKILISHAHPDHFMGLEVLAQSFPNAQVLTTANVVTDLEQDGPWMFALLQKKLGFEGPTRLITPRALSRLDLTIEDTKLEVVEFGEAESKHTAALHIPRLKVLFSADLVYDQTHLYLQERHLKSWLARLDELEVFVKGNISTLYPGHGRPGGNELIASTRAYLNDFAKAIESGDSKIAEQEMLAKYPVHHAKQFLSAFSIPSYFPTAVFT